MEKSDKDFEEDEEATSLPCVVLTRRRNNCNLYFASFVMLVGAISTGLMLGMSSPLIPGLENDSSRNAISINKREASWIGSLLTLGGIAGGILSGFLIQSIGRKPTAILSGLPYVAGLLLICFATDVWMIYVGRIVTGIAMSATTLVIPTYISEVSTESLRGLLCSGNQLGITTGVFIVYGLGGVLTWRWLSLSIAFIPLSFSVAVLFIPETPRFLLLKSRMREAREALQKLRGKNFDVSEELEELQDSIESSSESSSWREILVTRSLRVPLLIAMATMFFQQFSGVNSVSFYLKTIFQDAGFKSASELQLALLLVAGIQVIFTLVSCALVDRLGRKVLLSVSGLFMALSMGSFGAYFLLMDDGYKGELSWLALSSVIVYISTFSLGFGPIPWIIMSEIIPLRARGKCGGLLIAFNLLCAFIVTSEFFDLQQAITMQGTFWCYGGICLLGVIFTLVVIPETKGHSLEEIERHYMRKDSVYQPIGSPIKNQDI